MKYILPILLFLSVQSSAQEPYQIYYSKEKFGGTPTLFTGYMPIFPILNEFEKIEIQYIYDIEEKQFFLMMSIEKNLPFSMVTGGSLVIEAEAKLIVTRCPNNLSETTSSILGFSLSKDQMQILSKKTIDRFSLETEPIAIIRGIINHPKYEAQVERVRDFTQEFYDKASNYNSP